MTLLAIDTSTPACSVAIWHAGERHQILKHEERQHTKIILPMIDEALAHFHLKTKDLKGIICSIGPGAFTGLRIGASVAMGLATAVNCHLYPVSSLALLAETGKNKTGENRVLALLDARMGEIYAGLDGLPDILVRPEALPPEYLNAKMAVGSGAFFTLPIPAEPNIVPEALFAFDLMGQAQSPLEPLNLNYLRNQIVN